MARRETLGTRRRARTPAVWSRTRVWASTLKPSRARACGASPGGSMRRSSSTTPRTRSTTVKMCGITYGDRLLLLAELEEMFGDIKWRR